MRYLNFDIDSAEISDLESNSEFLTATIDAFSTGYSRNNTYCDLESLEKSAPTIYEKPILFTVDKTFNDFYTHVDPDKSLIAGFVVPNSGKIIENTDNRSTLQVTAKIWARYAKSFLDVFNFSNSKKKKVSVEVAVLDSEENNDILNMKDWIFSGICVLGDLITEASPGANIVMNFAEANQEYKKAYETTFSRQYTDVDFSIPPSVKSNAKKGLELHKEHKRGGTPVGLAHARHLLNNSVSNSEKIRSMAKYFSRHKSDDLSEKNPPSNEYIGFMLYGGNTGRRWSQDITSKLDEKDANNISYFDDNIITFPYKDIKDINPAIKGIDPEPTLAQANAISRQADAIGSDDKKNGWAIAISSFKKTHEVKDGKWVKKSEKEAMSMGDEKKEFEEEKVEEKNMAETPAEEKKEDPAEERAETPEEEKAEQKEDKKDMSLDANADVSAMLAMLVNETEDNVALSAKFSKEDGTFDFGMIAQAMYSKMCQMAEEVKMCNSKMATMAEENTAYMVENKELKEFKANIEGKQFEYEVNYTLKEVEMDVPKEELMALKEDAKNFTLANIDGWKNAVKAKAFSFSKQSKKEDKPFAIGLPFTSKSNEKSTSLWG